jgi:Rad3-related DNA helicase
LEEFFYGALERYYLFAKLSATFKLERDETGTALEFPYPSYRKGQRALAVAAYKTISLGKKLFVEAPTGIGKTISTLFPSIKALTTKKCDKVFYLTAKTITRAAAEGAFELMFNKGLKIKTVTLTAKEKICLNSELVCQPESCSYAKGHFDRLNAALLDILSNEYLIKRGVIECYAEKHMVCPFEFTFDIVNFCDCVICDYNYVYDPKVFLKNYFAEGMENNFILLNDESHNLIDRAREMFSASLNNDMFKSLYKSFQKGPLKRQTKKIIDFITDLDYKYLSATGNCVFEKLNMDFNFLLYNFVRESDTFLQENRNSPRHSEVLNVFFKAVDFLRISDYFDTHFVFYIYKDNSGVFLKILCLDPSNMLSNILKRVRSPIFFSATLSPINYFKKVLGGEPDDFAIRIDSPFDTENFKLIIDTGISTKYVGRENSYLKIADRLNVFINGKKGNYFVFFPSYSYMEMVYDMFCFKYPEKKTIIQGRNLSESEKEVFLGNFFIGNDVLAFVVMGGVFSEGIDLIGDKLIGACVVSVGLPLISTERGIISDYYKKTEGNGFNYAYKFPGINKVLQAAGRVIRSEADRGVILLIDDRFNNYEYKILYPPNWAKYSAINDLKTLQAELQGFWGGQ